MTMGSFIGRGNQFIQLVKVLYCKLVVIGKKNTNFPTYGPGFTLQNSDGRQVCYHCATVAPHPQTCRTRKDLLCRCSTGTIRPVTRYFFEGRGQCLHGQIGSISSYRSVGESHQNIKHV